MPLMGKLSHRVNRIYVESMMEMPSAGIESENFVLHFLFEAYIITNHKSGQIPYPDDGY